MPAPSQFHGTVFVILVVVVVAAAILAPRRVGGGDTSSPRGGRTAAPVRSGEVEHTVRVRLRNRSDATIRAACRAVAVDAAGGALTAAQFTTPRIRAGAEVDVAVELATAVRPARVKVTCV